MGWLDFLTEVHVNHPTFESVALNSPSKPKSNNSNDIFKKYFDENHKKGIYFHLYPISSQLFEKIREFGDVDYPFTGFMLRNDKINKDLIALLNIPSLHSTDRTKATQFYVFIHVLNELPSSCKNNIYVNREFFDISSAQIATGVTLKSIEETPCVDTITIRTNFVTSKIAVQNFSIYFAEKCRKNAVVLNSGVPFKINAHKFLCPVFENKFCLVDNNFLKNLKSSFEFSENVPLNSMRDSEQQLDYYNGINETLLKDIVLAMEINLKFSRIENVLVVGKSKCGLCIYIFIINLIYLR